MQEPSTANFSHVTGMRRILYMVTPNESSFEKLDQVPNYVIESTPMFTTLIILEHLVLWLLNKPLPRLDDTITSVGAGMISRLPSLLFRSIELVTYLWIWENYRIAELPWDSTWTWIICMIGVDFCYYWVHRMGHEINFMWAAHQAHHSSEEYNLTTALRQSLLQSYSSWIFYLPLALFIPPSVVAVHWQFNLLYQFWIHTEVVGWLGPLEYIINTPSAHRVHHGRNRYCIDSNYGGTFIFFDILFGTYSQEQSDDDKVVYGLVHPIESRNAFYVQLCHWQYMLSIISQRDGLWNKLSTLLKGPGWEPGKPRMGTITDIPDIKYPQQKYRTDAPVWFNVYAIMHFIHLQVAYQLGHELKTAMSQPMIFASMVYILYTLTTIGSLYDQRSYGPVMEFTRCTFVSAILWVNLSHFTGIYVYVGYFVLAEFIVSSVIWSLKTARQIKRWTSTGVKQIKLN